MSDGPRRCDYCGDGPCPHPDVWVPALQRHGCTGPHATRQRQLRELLSPTQAAPSVDAVLREVERCGCRSDNGQQVIWCVEHNGWTYATKMDQARALAEKHLASARLCMEQIRKEARQQLAAAERVWEELVALMGCTSPDGSAELDQVRYLQERERAAQERIVALEAGLRPFADATKHLLSNEDSVFEFPGTWDAKLHTDNLRQAAKLLARPQQE